MANSITTDVQADQFDEFENVEALVSENDLTEKSKQESDEIKCKFCWDSPCSVENPLIKACACKGGLAFIHLRCLKEWIGHQKLTT